MTGTEPTHSLLDLLGRRIVNTNHGHGPGQITFVRRTKEGETYVTVSFDNAPNKLITIHLEKCLERGLIYFESAEEANEKRRIYDYLTRDREVQFLVHFTPDTNLESILEHGIMPRTLLAKQSIKADTPDEKRLDKCMDYSSFSISFPNYRVFYSKRNSTRFTYVVLIIDPQVILDLPLASISYLPDNAASSSIESVGNFIGLAAAQALFVEKKTYGKREYSREYYHLPLFYTTNPQAEVFIHSVVDPGYIRSIITPNYDQVKRIRRLLQHMRIDKPKVIVNNSFFSGRVDYRFWQNQSDESEVL